MALKNRNALSRKADMVVRAGAVLTCESGVTVQRALAVRGDRIVAVSEQSDGVDAWISSGTRVIDEPGATVLPAFDDTHTHLIYAADCTYDVPVHTATDIPGVLALIRERAAVTPAGEWIRSTTNWQELNLAERRMPTAVELDGATDQHPVLLKRGGHNVVANSYALRLGGVTRDTPDPAGGVIGRTADGTPNGRLIDAAMHRVTDLFPLPSRAQAIAGLDQASHQYAATGVGTVRDCAVPLAQLSVLQAACDAGRLGTRVRALVIAPTPDLKNVDEVLDAMEAWRYRCDPWLSVWGVKFLLDGGLEAGATEDPYVGHDDFCGLLMWEPELLAVAVEDVVRRGWRVGTHAYGDRAVRILLDVYETVLTRNPWLPTGSLVIEHAGLAGPEQRRRAVALGIPVTIQQPLLHDTAAVEIEYWGQERVAQLFPARAWIDDGALVAAGSDFPVGPFGAMQSVWGLVTRQTVAGVQGADQAISRAEAIELHTVAAARLLNEQHVRGSLVPGKLADFTIWPEDPTSCPVDTLRGLCPSVTVIGGRVVHTTAIP